MTNGTLASVDVGTNTIRMRIEVPGRPSRIERRITRLGEGLKPGGTLAPSAVERTVATLGDFAAILDPERAERVDAVGTNALRIASNSAEFVERVRREAGITVRVISGEEEARLMTLGVLADVPDHADPCVTFDVGGGSTEFVLVKGTGLSPGASPVIAKALSLPIGSVRLTEGCLTNDPPTSRELAILDSIVRDTLAGLAERLGWPRRGPGARRSVTNEGGEGGPPCYAPSLIGTAGTVTTLAALHLGLETYDPKQVTGAKLDRAALWLLYARLASMRAAERLALPGMEKGREDVIVAGAAIAIGVLGALGEPSLTASDGGILEGILIAMRGGPRGPGETSSAEGGKTC